MHNKSIDYSKSLAGHLLVATPQMEDPRFRRRAIFICQHDKNAAMGLIINQPSKKLTFNNIAHQLKLEGATFDADEPIYIGGPVDAQRGYILHTDDQRLPESISVTDNICLSMHVDMIIEIARGLGPVDAKVILGRAGWGAGQLEQEMRKSMWFHFPATAEMIFTTATDQIWDRSFTLMGINAGSLSPQSGNA